MLVLSRKYQQKIVIGKDIVIQVLEVRGANDNRKVRLGITAPQGVRIVRAEVLREPEDDILPNLSL